MVSITVVTGFLGSGKTSLIAHLLDSTPDRPIAVIVNELALQSIDSAYLHGGEHIDAADGPLLRSVSGGRAGAGKAPQVIEHIEDLIAAKTPPEAIVIETSGSSPAATLVAAIENAPRLREAVRVDSVITVVDVTSLPQYWQDPQLRPLLQEQLESADLIVLNKADRAGFWMERKATRIVRKTNPAATVGTTEYGRLRWRKSSSPGAAHHRIGGPVRPAETVLHAFSRWWRDSSSKPSPSTRSACMSGSIATGPGLSGSRVLSGSPPTWTMYSSLTAPQINAR
jgi:G3E family GTPase